MKNRPKQPPVRWRLIWFQRIDGVRRMKWHTGSLYECEVLQRACVSLNEPHWLRGPGTFKE